MRVNSSHPLGSHSTGLNILPMPLLGVPGLGDCDGRSKVNIQRAGAARLRSLPMRPWSLRRYDSQGALRDRHQANPQESESHSRLAPHEEPDCHRLGRTNFRIAGRLAFETCSPHPVHAATQNLRAAQTCSQQRRSRAISCTANSDSSGTPRDTAPRRRPRRIDNSTPPAGAIHRRSTRVHQSVGTRQRLKKKPDRSLASHWVRC